MLLDLIKNLLKPRPRGRLSTPAASIPDAKRLEAARSAFGHNEFDEALAHVSALLDVNPDDSDAHLLHGMCLSQLAQHEAAISALKKLVLDCPTSAPAWKALGSAARDAKDNALMLDCYREALAINPQQADIEVELGSFMFNLRRHTEARAHFENAIALCPAAITYHHFGCSLYAAGRPDLAQKAFTQATALEPNSIDSHRGRFLTGLYTARTPEQVDHDIYAAFAACSRRHAPSVPIPLRNADHARIRIGYVTSDFSFHPVGRNMLPIFEHHDRVRFEIIVYADIRAPDANTVQFQQLSDVWRDIHKVNDEEVAQLIRNDEIDVLVLLAGHFDKNRPQLCCHRAAPVHISLHDAATSGLNEMDYLISDIHMTPPDSRERFSERVVTLPTFFLHPSIENSPDPGSPPFVKNGFITFGSFNNPSKLNPEVFALWARVLHAVPNSRLCLKYHGRFLEPEMTDWCAYLFQSFGIDQDRLSFPDSIADRASHLAIYQQIDIALDTFPFTGSTTTFEALWMGVPVITLTGDLMVGRWSTAMLRRIGLEELVAQSEDEYLAIAGKLAANPDRLLQFRQELRSTLADSPLCDAKRRTRHLERIYRSVFKKYLSTVAQPLAPIAQTSADDWKHFCSQIVTLSQNSQVGEAGLAVERLLAIARQPDYEMLTELNEVAIQLINMNAYFLSLRILEHLSDCGTANPNIFCNLGIAYAKVSRYEDALLNYQCGLKLSPDSTALLYNQAVTLRELERYTEAKAALQNLLRLDPGNVDAWIAFAAINRELGDMNAALECARKALEIAPHNPLAASLGQLPNVYVAMGNALRERGELDQSESYFNRVLEHWPDHAEARLGRAFVHLLRGEFAPGWQDYEARRHVAPAIERMALYPEWQGQSLQDSTLLIYGEQGLGEDIMLASCYNELIQEAKHVVIDCDPRLQPLFARSFPRATVVGSPRRGPPTWLNRTPPINWQILAGSIPKYRRNDWTAFPLHKGYLSPDPLRVQVWQGRLTALGSGLKVGISWQGGLARTRKQSRSIPLPELEPLLTVKGCHFINLQYGHVAKDLLSLQESGVDITHWEDATNDFEETAALIASLDLVISVCTTAIHLTGALGKPVWVMTPPAPEWRYLASGENMPWYPTARLIRAVQDQTWFPLIDTIKSELNHRITSHPYNHNQ